MVYQGLLGSNKNLSQLSEDERKKRPRAACRIVVKLGTSTITGGTGMIDIERVAPIVLSIAGLRTENRCVVLVSSGIVGLVVGRLCLASARTKDVVTRQACAAAGQSLLMNAYENLFQPHSINVAQILLAEDEQTARRSWLKWMRQASITTLPGDSQMATSTGSARNSSSAPASCTRARRPVALEGFTTHRRLLTSDGHTVADYSTGKRTFKHRKLESDI